MYCVYWFDTYVNAPLCREHMNLNEAVRHCAELRGNQDNRFVTLAVEDPNMVGKMGVSDKLPDDYDWVKRRDALSVRRKG